MNSLHKELITLSHVKLINSLLKIYSIYCQELDFEGYPKIQLEALINFKNQRKKTLKEMLTKSTPVLTIVLVSGDATKWDLHV